MIRGLEKGQKPALIISECQRSMIDPEIQDRELSRQAVSRGMVANIASLAEAFRAADAPVIHCTLVPATDYVDFPSNCAMWANLKRGGHLRRGQPGVDIIEGLTPQPQDIVSERRGGLSGFHATELERTLRALDVQTVVLTGVSTNLALMALAIEAVNRLFQVVLPEDCTAGGDLEGHDTQLRLHFPLLATVTRSASVAEAVALRGWSNRS